MPFLIWLSILIEHNNFFPLTLIIALIIIKSCLSSSFLYYYYSNAHFDSHWNFSFNFLFLVSHKSSLTGHHLHIPRHITAQTVVLVVVVALEAMFICNNKLVIHRHKHNNNSSSHITIIRVASVQIMYMYIMVAITIQILHRHYTRKVLLEIMEMYLRGVGSKMGKYRFFYTNLLNWKVLSHIESKSGVKG